MKTVLNGVSITNFHLLYQRVTFKPQKQSATMLGNSTAIADVFKRIGRNWDILNAKRAFGYTRKYDEDTY